jgi:hypothetical protein
LGKEGDVVMVARAAAMLGNVWPLAAIGLALVINGIWIVMLGYGISKLF